MSLNKIFLIVQNVGILIRLNSKLLLFLKHKDMTEIVRVVLIVPRILMTTYPIIHQTGSVRLQRVSVRLSRVLYISVRNFIKRSL